MWFDITHMRAFYAKPLGQLVAQLLAAHLATYWPRQIIADKAQPSHKIEPTTQTATPERILGLGYALPFLDRLWPQAELFAFMPPRLGSIAWTNTVANTETNTGTAANISKGGNRTCLIDEAAFPLADNSVDRILLLHMLEFATEPEALFGEVWRVLAPGGRVLLVAPNRYGVWAHSQRTVWSGGNHFSKRQIRRLLVKAEFVSLNWQACFLAPPSALRLTMRHASYVERAGRRFAPALCGLLIVEATKQVYAPIGKPARAASLASVLRPAQSTPMP